ncbi:MAG: hypothetical protein GX020_04635 [Firmicutes bacterium]|jgi:uncharacterized protein YaaQ|nr:hypothetical protein [Bacillota bacterium]
MKLMMAIVQDQCVPTLLERMTSHGFSVTKLASTGGFLREGNTTIICGISDDQVEGFLEIVKSTCNATIFSLDVERFEKI